MWSTTRISIVATVFQLGSENVIRKAQKNKVGLKLNGTHQLLVYAVDINLLVHDIDTIKRNR
jgi:hypothetical protein